VRKYSNFWTTRLAAVRPIQRVEESNETHSVPRLWRRLLGFDVSIAEMVGPFLCKSKIIVNCGGNSYSKKVPPYSYLALGAGADLGVV
jgi:hypothetical protein